MTEVYSSGFFPPYCITLELCQHPVYPPFLTCLAALELPPPTMMDAAANQEARTHHRPSHVQQEPAADHLSQEMWPSSFEDWEV